MSSYQNYIHMDLHRSTYSYMELDRLMLVHQGAGKRPRQCVPKGLKTKETATRGPEGPESGLNTRVRGPEGPEDEQNPVPVLTLASAILYVFHGSAKNRDFHGKI